MSSTIIQNLSAEFTKAGFFERLSLTVKDWDVVLDKRDAAEFGDAWVRSNEALGKKKYPVQSDQIEVNRIREYAFKVVFRITGNSEAAGYVSDDIGLIGEAVAKGELAGWVEDLLQSYRNGKFPC
ncbi:hypothetical protein [Pseudomonas abietaniphila]|uniref:hypothetical protein n=1 Tax=Pseudomonas abietaniphila TaxID=89065 RepID=UPI000782F1DF|nr:hypothetical protein [Pseudomonas abietaniphila]